MSATVIPGKTLSQRRLARSVLAILTDSSGSEEPATWMVEAADLIASAVQQVLWDDPASGAP